MDFLPDSTQSPVHALKKHPWAAKYPTARRSCVPVWAMRCGVHPALPVSETREFAIPALIFPRTPVEQTPVHLFEYLSCPAYDFDYSIAACGDKVVLTLRDQEGIPTEQQR